MSSYTSTSNFDNFLLQTLMTRLQINPPTTHSHTTTTTTTTTNPFLSQSLEDLLFANLLHTTTTSSSDDDDDTTTTTTTTNSSTRTRIRKEESKLEKEIICTILSGKTDSLKPNSGQAVSIGEHHICIGFHEEVGSEYRVWEWHGHLMLFDEENGYSPEYIYGNYFERVKDKVRSFTKAIQEEVDEEEEEEEEDDDEEDTVRNLGLRELIDGGEAGPARILHRNICVGSTKV